MWVPKFPSVVVMYLRTKFTISRNFGLEFYIVGMSRYMYNLNVQERM